MDRNIEELQDELKVLKNEIKETLIDIREHILTNVENPFPVEMTQQAPPRQATERPPAMPSGDEVTKAMPGLMSAPGGQAAPAAAPPGGGGVIQVPNIGAASWGPEASDAPAETPASSTPGGQGPPPAAPPDSGTTRVPDARPAPRRPEARGTAAKAAAVSREVPTNGHGRDGKAALEAAESGGEGEADAAPWGEQEIADTEPVGDTDLVTVAMLVPWIEDGIRKIGRKRLKGIIEIRGSMGGLTPQLREVLLHLISLDGGDGAVGKVPLSQSLRVLADLDNLIWRSRFDRSPAALLSAFLKGKDPTSYALSATSAQPNNGHSR